MKLINELSNPYVRVAIDYDAPDETYEVTKGRGRSVDWVKTLVVDRKNKYVKYIYTYGGGPAKGLWYAPEVTSEEFDKILNLLKEKTTWLRKFNKDHNISYDWAYEFDDDDVYAKMNQIDDNESLSKKENFVYQIGQLDEGDLIVDYSVDTPGDEDTVREHFIALLSDLIRGKISIDYPCTVRGSYENAEEPSWSVNIASVDELKNFRHALRSGKYAEN